MHSVVRCVRVTAGFGEVRREASLSFKSNEPQEQALPTFTQTDKHNILSRLAGIEE